MKTKFILLVLAMVGLIFVCSSCQQPAIEKFGTNNSAIPVELLFEHDGCKIYRFIDGNRHHYFGKCKDATSICHQEGCGKNCSYEECLRVFSEAKPNG